MVFKGCNTVQLCIFRSPRFHMFSHMFKQTRKPVDTNLFMFSLSNFTPCKASLRTSRLTSPRESCLSELINVSTSKIIQMPNQMPNEMHRNATSLIVSCCHAVVSKGSRRLRPHRSRDHRALQRLPAPMRIETLMKSYLSNCVLQLVVQVVLPYVICHMSYHCGINV